MVNAIQVINQVRQNELRPDSRYIRRSRCLSPLYRDIEFDLPHEICCRRGYRFYRFYNGFKRSIDAETGDAIDGTRARRQKKKNSQLCTIPFQQFTNFVMKMPRKVNYILCH